MSRIRSRDTKPEMIVRSIVHQLGYRFRLHKKDLPGKPDLVFARHMKIIEVRGCFFHAHSCKYGRVKPATNAAFWSKKRDGNVARDKRNQAALRRLGWKVLVVWECNTKSPKKLVPKLLRFLQSVG